MNRMAGRLGIRTVCVFITFMSILTRNNPMKRFFSPLFCAALFFVACGDDSSSVSADEEEIKSSEASVSSSSSDERLSSSAKNSSDQKSSSSKGENKENRHSSSSGSVSSASNSVGTSSSGSLVSSAAETLESSSSMEQSSSSESESLSSSSSSKTAKGWSWDVPKELHLNPYVEYDSIKDSRDGHVYKTIKIGDLTWMAENLNYYDKDNLSLKDKSWCYNTDVDEDVSCAVVGRHYTWAAAIDSVKLATDADNPLDCGYGKECELPGKVRGICPLGWHLPSEDEWNDLITFVGKNSTTGKELKSQTGWNTKGKQGLDTYGFSALPAGYISEEGYADGVGARAYFWSSTDKCETGVSYMMLLFDSDEVYMRESCGYMTKEFRMSVRCIKD
jgi:uncharacterized protein (TIGR02145 family)